MYKIYCDNYLLMNTQLDDDKYRVINPVLNVELNKAGSLTFTIYPSHENFDKLNKLKSIVQVYQDNYLIFRGRILNDESGFYNQKQVTCEGELAFLNDSIQRPYEFNDSVSNYLTMLINNHNAQVDSSKQFVIGTITVDDGDTTNNDNTIVRSDTEYKTTWELIQNKLIDSLGGYLFVDFDGDNNRRINYLSDFNTINTQTIEFGKNLLDLHKVIKGEDVATAIIPLGVKNEDTDERLTIKSVNDDVDYVFNQTAVNIYGWIFKTVIWDDVTNASNLKTKAEAYLANSINLINSIEISAVDEINTFRLGQYVKVTTEPHDIDINLLVQKLSINLFNPTSNKLTLGAVYSTFTEQNIEAGKEYRANVEIIVRDSVYQTERELYSAIEQSGANILNTVATNYYLKGETDQLVSSVRSELEQTSEGFEMRFTQFDADIDDLANDTQTEFTEIKQYIRFEDGNIILGEEGNELTLKIQNDRISFLESNLEVAYFSNRKLYITDGEYINSLKLGKFAFTPRTNGNLSFKKVVD